LRCRQARADELGWPFADGLLRCGDGLVPVAGCGGVPKLENIPPGPESFQMNVPGAAAVRGKSAGAKDRLSS